MDRNEIDKVLDEAARFLAANIDVDLLKAKKRRMIEIYLRDTLRGWNGIVVESAPGFTKGKRGAEMQRRFVPIPELKKR